MRFVLSVRFYGAQERMAALPAAERDVLVEQFRAFFRSPEVCDGNQLQPPDTATTVRFDDGVPVPRPGPHPGEPLGGYYLVEAPDQAAAVDLAARFPALPMGAEVEIRPVVAG